MPSAGADDAVAVVALFGFGTVALVNVIAFLPARTAAETRPAVTLRSE